MDVIRKL